MQWRTGAGWLILLGGGRWEDNETIHSQAISAIIDESPIAIACIRRRFTCLASVMATWLCDTICAEFLVLRRST